jgi:hypothetical protein
LRHANAWTRWAACLMLTLPVTGCVSAVSGDAICAGTEQARTEHAAALASDGGPLSLVTGARLIQILDAGCANDP